MLPHSKKQIVLQPGVGVHHKRSKNPVALFPRPIPTVAPETFCFDNAWVQPKLDGVPVVMFWHHNSWVITTYEAWNPTYFGVTLQDLVCTCVSMPLQEFGGELCKQVVYHFELTGPLTSSINWSYQHNLYLVRVTNNDLTIEFSPDEVKEMCDDLWKGLVFAPPLCNPTNLKEPSFKDSTEGYVCIDNNMNRYQHKNPKYLKLRNMLQYIQENGWPKHSTFKSRVLAKQISPLVTQELMSVIY